jgi:hypothetical protein
VHLDPARRKRFIVRENVGAATVAADTERQHVWVFDEKEQVANTVRATLFHERALYRKRVRVRHQAKPPDLDSPTHMPYLTYATHLTHQTL